MYMGEADPLTRVYGQTYAESVAQEGSWQAFSFVTGFAPYGLNIADIIMQFAVWRTKKPQLPSWPKLCADLKVVSTNQHEANYCRLPSQTHRSLQQMNLVTKFYCDLLHWFVYNAMQSGEPFVVATGKPMLEKYGAVFDGNVLVEFPDLIRHLSSETNVPAIVAAIQKLDAEKSVTALPPATAPLPVVPTTNPVASAAPRDMDWGKWLLPAIVVGAALFGGAS